MQLLGVRAPEMSAAANQNDKRCYLQEFSSKVISFWSKQSQVNMFDDTEPVTDFGWTRSSGFTLCNLILGCSIMHLCYKTSNSFGKLLTTEC